MKHALILFILFSFFVTGCEQKSVAVHEYNELITPPTDMDQISRTDIPHDNIHARVLAQRNVGIAPASSTKWITPVGWVEIAGSGMRLVSFQSSRNKELDCSIVVLSGEAGGIEANIQRWLGQIKLEMAPEQLHQFLQNQKQIESKGGLKGILVDFRPLQANAPDEATTIVTAIYQTENETIFIKMMAPKTVVASEMENFKKLYSSIAK